MASFSTKSNVCEDGEMVAVEGDEVSGLWIEEICSLNSIKVLPDSHRAGGFFQAVALPSPLLALFFLLFLLGYYDFKLLVDYNNVTLFDLLALKLTCHFLVHPECIRQSPHIKAF